MENIFVEFLPPWVETGLQPAFYDKESGTVLQQTARMYDRVNMLIRMFNKLSKETKKSFEELYNYVHDYFDNLDVQEEVNKKIDELVEDGTLTNLLSEVTNSKTLVGHTFYRDCTEWINGVTSESENNPIKGYMNGITTTPSSLIMAINAGGSYADILNKCYLVEVSKSTKQTLKESFIEINHANAIAYNQKDGLIYVASNTKYVDGQTVQWNKIVIVDYETFNVIDEVEISSDITTDYITGVSYDNVNNVLAISTSDHVYIMSDDFSEVIKDIQLETNNVADHINPLFGNHSWQYSALFNNKIYQVHFFADGITVYDKEGHLLDNIYNIDFEVPLGEFESIAVEEDGTIYVAQVQISSSDQTAFQFYDRVITKSNIVKGGYKNQYKKEYTQAVGTWGNKVYVNPNTTNKIQAGTSTYPYKHIQQAIIDSNVDNIPYYIECADTGDYGFIIARNNVPLFIDGKNKATFYGMITQKQNVTVSNATFNLENDFTVAGGYKNIYNDSSDVEYNNCTFNGKNDKSTCAISTFHGDLTINGCTFNNFSYVLRNGQSADITIFACAFNNCTKKYYNSNYVAIHYNNSAIYGDCDSNGTLPTNVDCYQYITGTVNNNTITFNCNLSSVVPSSVIFTAVAKRSGYEYWMNTPSRCATNNISNTFKTDNSLLFITMSHTWSTTGMTFTPKVYELLLSDSSVSDVTSQFTFTYSTVLVR